MPTGSPFFETPEAMQEAIDRFFEEEKSPTITGLALYLGFCDRHSFYDYEKKDLFTHTIKKARARMVAYYEQKVVGNQAAGPIFMLKNFGYSDKQEIDLNARVMEMPTIKRDGVELKFDIGSGATDPTEEENDGP